MKASNHAERSFHAGADADLDPLVSIVIPTYNHAHFLKEALESAAAQTFKNIEIIVVDDESTDNTPEVVDAFPDRRVRYTAVTHRGLPYARNFGLKNARGEFIVFLDADDRLYPHHVQLGLESFDRRRGLGFVCGDIRCFGDLGDFRHIHRCSPTPDHYATLLRSCFIVNVGACIFSRQVLVDIGGFDEGLPSSEDWDLFLRITRVFPIHCHHEQVLEYRRVSGQMSQDPERMLRGAVRALRAQRVFARQRPEYWRAYRDGQDDIAKYYGMPMLKLIWAQMRVGRWHDAIRLSFLVLLDCQRVITICLSRLCKREK